MMFSLLGGLLSERGGSFRHPQHFGMGQTTGYLSLVRIALARIPSEDSCFAKEIDMNSTKPLQGRIALVTGVGRRAGIGAAICREIAKNGGDVFFTYWQQYDKETHSENSENDPAAIAAELVVEEEFLGVFE